MSRIFCGLIAALLALPSLASDVFAHPQTPAQARAVLSAAMPDLGAVEVLRGDYIQRKYLQEIPRALTSSGEFLLVRDRGVWWHTQVPLESELMLSHRPGQAPGLDIAASTFFALFALDLDTLARSFELFAMQSESSQPHWTLGLRPRDAALATWFEQITLAGGKQLDKVILIETAGDRTEIELKAVAEPLTNLSATEKQRFAP